MTDIDDDGVDATTETVNGRRNLLTKGAVAAAVAAVAGVAMSRPASAADTDPLTIGVANEGTNLTRLTGSTLQVIDGATAAAGPNKKPALWGRSALEDGVGVLGEAIGTLATHGVYGRSTGTFGVGVYGEATGTGGNGVHGFTNTTGAGVYGNNDGTSGGAGVIGQSTAGSGVIGEGGQFDLVASGSGRVLVGTAGAASPPANGTLGTIARDDAGNLWYAYAANQWSKLGGPATAGSFHPIEPARVFDSRLAAYAPNDGPLTSNTNRVVSVKDGRDAAGAVTVADVVPAGATAVAINVTVAGPTGPNYLSVVPGDAAGFTASTINWPGGFDTANGAIVKLDADRQLKVFCGDQSGSTNVIIDVTGYYL